MPETETKAHKSSRLKKIAFLALLSLYAIVITGATVRLTGSGLGCPNWPTCTGVKPVPELSFHPIIEFANRMVSFPVLVFTLGTLVIAWRQVRAGSLHRGIAVGATLTVAGVFANVAVGAVTIFSELNPQVVAAHFFISMATLASAVWVWQWCDASSKKLPETDGHNASKNSNQLVKAMSIILPLLTVSVIVPGVLTTASGPHSGGSDQQVIERINMADLYVMLHARAGFLLLGLLIFLVIKVRGTKAPLLLTVLVLLQVAIGEIQYRAGLPRGLVLAHVANAALIWCCASFLTFQLQAMGRDNYHAAQEINEPELQKGT